MEVAAIKVALHLATSTTSVESVIGWLSGPLPAFDLYPSIGHRLRLTIPRRPALSPRALTPRAQSRAAPPFFIEKGHSRAW